MGYLLAADMPSTSQREAAGQWELIARCAFALLLGALASWRLWFEPGVVGLLHDWAIMPFASQHVLYAEMMFHGWVNSALGSPFVYPSDYPIRWFFALLGGIGIDGGPISKAVVFLVPACSFLSGVYLCRLLTRNTVAAWGGGLLYAMNPVVLNKLASGQLAYLVAYPVLAACVGFAYAVSRPQAPQNLKRAVLQGAALGGILAVVAVQIQLVFLCIIAVAVIVLTGRRSFGQKLVLLAFAGAVLLVTQSPVIVGVHNGGAGIAGQVGFAPTIEKLRSQSIEISKAIRLTGYITHYQQYAVVDWSELWQKFSWVAIAIAVGGLLFARRSLRIAALGALFLLMLFISGADGPIAPAMIWLYQHISLMQMFRELYHLMAAVALIYAVGVACAIRAVSRWRWGKAATALIAGIVFVFGALPLASGDAGGWLHAFPLASTYRQAFTALEKGDGRLMWLPMDQPMAFDGIGFGGDPMAGISERGSMPGYSLDWPLNALDYAVRSNAPEFESLAEALGFSTVAQRSRLRTRLARFTMAPILSKHFFRSPFITKSLGKPAEVFGDTTVYTLAHPLPIAFPARMLAVAPMRASVGARLMLHGFAPVAFGTHLPQNTPFAVFYDAGDLPYEALQSAGAATVPQPFESDARAGFAVGEPWWWYRWQYADNPSFILASGSHALTIPHKRLRNAELVLAWIATPAGGHIRVDAGNGKHFTIDTHAPPDSDSDRSATIDLGRLAANQPLIIDASDPYGEVAIRGYGLLERPRAQQMMRTYKRFLSQAARAVAITPASRLVAAGDAAGAGPILPSMTRGTAYAVRVHARSGELLALTDADTRLIATFRPQGDMQVAQFISDGAPLSILGVDANQRWSVVRYKSVPQNSGVKAPAASKAATPLAVYNVQYSPRWHLHGSYAHLPSILGTNIFVGGTGVQPYDAARKSFEIAFCIGTLALIAGLVCLLETCRRKVV